MYEGPFAVVVVARGKNVELAREGTLNVLAPVRGNKVSRRATEVALAIAKMSNSQMTALYVLGTVGLSATQRRLRRLTRNHHYEEAVLKDIVELAAREGRSIRTTLRLDVSPEDAILRQARLGHHNLIVPGVGRPAGQTLFFGEVAAAILENSDCSILLYQVKSGYGRGRSLRETTGSYHQGARGFSSLEGRKRIAALVQTVTIPLAILIRADEVIE
jgi:nucleotide-binding universal stress UspA family protein